MHRIKSAVAALGLTAVLLLSGCTDPAVSDAMKAIDAIGEVTAESASAIEAANAAYDALSPEQKEQVENFDKLQSANEQLKPASVPLGEAVMLNTAFGDVEVALEGFAMSTEDVEGLKDAGTLAEGQTVGYLLFTINNISRHPGEGYEDYLKIEGLLSIEDASGNALSALDYTGSYPGYACVGAGVFGLYEGSLIEVGETKQMCVPYAIDASASEITVVFNNEAQAVLNID